MCFGGVVTFSLHEPILIHASSSIEKVEAFESLEGDTKYIGSQYREQYALDLEKTGVLDMLYASLNAIANGLFKIVINIGAIITTLFYQIMTLDVAKLFAGEINQIQQALKSSVFDSFFLLAFVGSAWMLLKKVSKRDITGIIMEISKVICILLLSTLVVTKSATVLTATTEITKSISVSALLNINSPKETVNLENYAAKASGVLWKSLIHDPWIFLEFNDTSPSSEDVDKFLTTQPDTEAREKLVESYRSEHESAMRKSEGSNRIGFIAVYLTPFLVKCGIYGFMSVIQFAFQIMAVCYVLLAPVILLLALVPAFGGIDLVTTWLKKILESQVMIVVVTFIMGVVMKLDSLLYQKAGELGWLIVIVIEAVVALIVILNYKSILKGIGKIESVTKNPKAFQYQLMKSGNVMQPTSDLMEKAEQKAQKGARFINDQIQKRKEKQIEPSFVGNSSSSSVNSYLVRRPSLSRNKQTYNQATSFSTPSDSIQVKEKSVHKNREIDQNQPKIKRPSLAKQTQNELNVRQKATNQAPIKHFKAQTSLKDMTRANHADSVSNPKKEALTPSNLSKNPINPPTNHENKHSSTESKSVKPKIKRPSLKPNLQSKSTPSQNPSTYTLNGGSTPTPDQIKNAPSLFHPSQTSLRNKKHPLRPSLKKNQKIPTQPKQPLPSSLKKET